MKYQKSFAYKKKLVLLTLTFIIFLVYKPEYTNNDHFRNGKFVQ